MEQVRKGLIKWNIAPLTVVAFLMFVTWKLTEFVISQACNLDPVFATGLFGCIGGMGLILQKMYGSMQRDRSLEEDV